MDVLELVKKHNGFDSFNPMQEKALAAGLLEKSVVVSAPTASGKTLVAEIASLNSVLNVRKKVIYTCPLRALASEHAHDFKEKYGKSLGIKVALSTGDFDSGGQFLANKDIIFTTNEKLNSLLNHRPEWLSRIGLMVADEIHLLGSDRGPALEIAITKLRFLNPKMKVLGLSATIPNALEISKWLKAEFAISDYRPIKLSEGVLHDGTIEFLDREEKIKLQDDDVTSLALDTLNRGKQALVFANTRKTSESYAKKLAALTEKKLTPSDKIALEKAAAAALGALEQPTEQCRTISDLIKRGACFHNAGLLQKQRHIIETVFKKGHLKFISSTPTLAAGINMPAFRVIIPSLYRYSGFGMEKIPVYEFKQMSGRAGRPKYDSEGQAILIAKTEMEKDDYIENFVKGEVERIDSMLGDEKVLRFHLLAAIATGFIHDLESAEKFFSETFYASQNNGVSGLFKKINGLIRKLVELEFVSGDDSYFEATPLGKRVAELYLDPLSADQMLKMLRKNVHADLAYLFIISSLEEFEPWLNVPKGAEGELYEQLQLDKGRLPVNVDVEMFTDNTLLQKFYTSQMLSEWISEVREQELVDKFKVQPGILRAKLDNADWLTYSALELAKVLSLESHYPHLNKMRKRLTAGIKEELIPLCELRGIGRVRGRRLFNAGVKGIADVKNTDIKDLEKVLGAKVALSVKEQLEIKK